MDKDASLTTQSSLTTQQKLIVDYLMQGRTLTNMVAMTCLGVGSLTSRIAELRKLGYDIEDTMDTTSDPHGRAFKKYWIAAAKEAKGDA